MNFSLSDDQQALLVAIQKLVDNFHVAPAAQPRRFEFSSELQCKIHEGGFFSAATVDELGPVAAVAMTIELCRLPVCVEAVASSFIAPHVCPERAGPFAVSFDDTSPSLRFGPCASTVIRVKGKQVAFAALQAGDVVPVESLFAYPMGKLRDPESLRWETSHGVTGDSIRSAWRLGVAAEIVGCLAAAISSVVEHVKHRTQFGRALGSFQAIQHRLAECSALVECARWLVFRAASTSQEEDIMMALAYAQDAITRVCYDLHQFMGAMGLTLEHPLHRWTYRAKLLRSEMGGASQHFTQLADLCWGATTNESEQSPEPVQ